MTTSVKVTACCASTKEVHADVCTVPAEEGQDVTVHEEVVLQDSESHEFYVYDDRVVTVREVVKPEPVAESIDPT